MTLLSYHVGESDPMVSNGHVEINVDSSKGFRQTLVYAS